MQKVMHAIVALYANRSLTMPSVLAATRRRRVYVNQFCTRICIALTDSRGMCVLHVAPEDAGWVSKPLIENVMHLLPASQLAHTHTIKIIL